MEYASSTGVRDWKWPVKQRLRAIVEDRDGVVWIGTSYGLNRIVGDPITTFLARDGLHNEVIDSPPQLPALRSYQLFPMSVQTKYFFF